MNGENSIQTIELKIEEYLNQVRTDPSARNYWFASKKIQQIDKSDLQIDELKIIKIATFSSHTLDLMKIYLEIDLRLIGLEPKVWVGPFNQYQQIILDKSSKLYQMEPELILFNIELSSLMSKDFEINFSTFVSDQIKKESDMIFDRIQNLLTSLRHDVKGLILFSNFIIPTFSPFGILESKQSQGYIDFYRYINEKLKQEYKDDPQIFIFDLDGIASGFGKKRITNYSNYYRGTILFNEEFISQLSSEYLGYIKAIKNLNKKAIVLDLDNTLWGGIIGEDGIEGIKLSNSFPGREFYDFQKLILTYYNRGIILAINSKNNYEDAIEVFQNHPSMILKEDNFAAMRINWQDKVQNLIEIADELNIGIDSLVFVDDNPVERERVKYSLPEVLVVDLPKNPAEYVAVFKRLTDFNTLSLTKEDLKRGEMYVARRKRENLKLNIQSMNDFIESLEVKAYIQNATEFSLPRVASLINRTNQFNLTTKRFTESEIKDYWMNSKKMKIYTLQVSDKFGDEGIVGVAMIDINKENWEIINFMMSCRVIGRKIETAFLYKIINDAITQKIPTISAIYLPTKKNKLVADFYPNHSFILMENSNLDTGMQYQMKLIEKFSYPDFIEVIVDE